MHQPSTSDSVFAWESAARPAPPPVLRELAEDTAMTPFKTFHAECSSVSLLDGPLFTIR